MRTRGMDYELLSRNTEESGPISGGKQEIIGKPAGSSINVLSSARAKGHAARTKRNNWATAILYISTGLLPIYFLVFAGLCIKHDGALLRPDSQAEWLLEAAKYGPTVFPILFAATISQFMTLLAAWRLEKQIKLGLLEYLLASRSFASAILSLAKLRMPNLCIPLILATWCLSPLGGQSALRIVSSELFDDISTADVFYLDTNYTGMTGTYPNQWDTYGSTIDSAFVTALGSPATSKNGSQDLYGNLQIPMLEALSLKNSSHEWTELDDLATPVHAALLGVPVTGIPAEANSSFSMETSYIYLDCKSSMETPVESDTQDLAMNLWNHTGRANVSAPVRPGQNNADVNVTYTTESDSRRGYFVLRDSTADHQYNDTNPRRLGFRSFASSNESTQTEMFSSGSWTEVWCDMTTTYIELQAQCYGGPNNCTASAVRESASPKWPKTATVLDGISTEPVVEEGVFSSEVADEFFERLLDSVKPRSFPRYSVLEAFFLDPDIPFKEQDPENMIPIGKLPDDIISRRFSQLVNTYMMAFTAPFAVTGLFTRPDPATKLQSFPDVPAAGDDAAYAISRTSAQVSKTQIVLRYHGAWGALLIALSLLLIVAGVATAVLDLRRRAPVVIDEFTSSLRNNPYVRLDQQSSTEDGAELARRNCDIQVMIGDVRPGEQEGYIAVATPSDEMVVRRVDRTRRYV